MNQVAVHVGQTTVDAVVSYGEPLVIDAKQMQNRGMEIGHTDTVHSCPVTDFIGLAKDESSPKAAARKQQ